MDTSRTPTPTPTTPVSDGLSRRDALALSLGAGAALALTPALRAALGLPGMQAGGWAPKGGGGGPMEKRNALIERAIPSTGEKLPVISFGARPVGGAAMEGKAEDVPAIKEVLKTFLDNGGKVVDVLHGGPAGEAAAAKAANELGLQNKFFWTTPLFLTIPTLPGHEGPPPKPTAAALRKLFDAKLKAFNVETIDLVQMLANTDIPTHFGVLSELKKEGKLRYIGVTDLAPPAGFKIPPGMPGYYEQLEAVMRDPRTPIDFIGVDYSIGDRRVEEKILPLAQEKKIAVFAYFPFDRNRIFKRASGVEVKLPEWASEFGAETWAQFFLKYVVAHPAITAVRCGTTKPEHMLDNLKGGIGVLPNEAQRKRMAEFVDALPPTPQPKPQVVTMPPPGDGQPPKAPKPAAVALSADVLDRYVGDWMDPAAGTHVKITRNGDKLRMKPGKAPEGTMTPLSETRFLTPWGAPIEFKVEDGKATSGTVEQGPFRIEIVRA